MCCVQVTGCKRASGSDGSISPNMGKGEGRTEREREREREKCKGRGLLNVAIHCVENCYSCNMAQG